jgi:hypothetical protein
VSPNKDFQDGKEHFDCEVLSLKQLLDYNRDRRCALLGH